MWSTYIIYVVGFINFPVLYPWTIYLRPRHCHELNVILFYISELHIFVFAICHVHYTWVNFTKLHDVISCNTVIFMHVSLQEETRENVTVSDLSFTPTTDDDGKSITCRAENPNITGAFLESSWKIDVVCKSLLYELWLTAYHCHLWISKFKVIKVLCNFCSYM